VIYVNSLYSDVHLFSSVSLKLFNYASLHFHSLVTNDYDLLGRDAVSWVCGSRRHTARVSFIFKGSGPINPKGRKRYLSSKGLEPLTQRCCVASQETWDVETTQYNFPETNFGCRCSLISPLSMELILRSWCCWRCRPPDTHRWFDDQNVSNVSKNPSKCVKLLSKDY